MTAKSETDMSYPSEIDKSGTTTKVKRKYRLGDIKLIQTIGFLHSIIKRNWYVWKGLFGQN